MNFGRNLGRVAVGLFALAAIPSIALAQPGAFGGGYGPPLNVVPPPKAFATSDEHYKYLLDQAKGGTKHTINSVPRWDGLWVTAGNTHMDMFISPSGFTGKVIEGVLTPPYEAAYKERWRQQQELGEVQYDRLTGCEPPGYPRWLLEPYSHEFVNLPQQSYMINDYGPGIRRVYIGQEHKNVYGTHSWYGDTIGFWDGNKLVTHTKYLLPADFTRWSPMTSNQFEVGRKWELKQYPGGHRAAGGSGYVLRQIRLRQTRQRRLRLSSCERARSRRPSRPTLGVRDEQQRLFRERHDDFEVAGRGRLQRSARHDTIPGPAGPVSRSDLQHYAAC